MSKVLFLGLPAYGHTNPSLPLVRELVQRGEQVVYYATDPFAARVEATGAQYRRYRNAFLSDLRELPERIDALSWLLMRTTGEVLDEELDGFRSQSPDYVIADSVAPWGQWTGEILGVPVVTSISTFAFNGKIMKYAASRGVRPKSARHSLSKVRHVVKALLRVRKLQQRYGVRGPGAFGIVSGRSALNIVYTSRLFQPCAESFDQRYRFIGPSMATRDEAADFPWDELQHPVIVYVSLGTLFNTDAGFYQECFQAFGGEDFQVILSSGGNVTPTELGAIPGNFIVRPHVPQLEVLGRAAAFVTHGGMNSVGESLYHGVPMVTIPQMGEQEIVSRRVEELGAGLYVAKAEATAERLRTSVRRLLAEPGFRNEAARVGKSLKAAGGAAAGAEAILEFIQAK